MVSLIFDFRMEFWESLALIEELLRPLKFAILAIECSIVDVCKAFRVVKLPFDEAMEVTAKFPTDQKDKIDKASLLFVL
jgi:hypothetical protein